MHLLLAPGSCKKALVYDYKVDLEGSYKISKAFRALYTAALQVKIAKATKNKNKSSIAFHMLPYPS